MKVVRSSSSLTGHLYPKEMFLVLIFTRDQVDPRAMVQLEGNVSLKNTVTPPGIDPGTVGLVAQCLNHYDTQGPNITFYYHSLLLLEFNFVTLFLCMGEKEKWNQFSLHKKKKTLA
jgi:hypothetical protein